MKKVFCFSLILALFGWGAKSVSAKKPEVLPVITEFMPEPDEPSYDTSWISVTFSKPVDRSFSIALSPREGKLTKLWFNGKTRLRWCHPLGLTWQPNTKYQVTLKSRGYFIWKGQKLRTLAWSFTTSSKQALAEVIQNMPFDPEDPLRYFPFPLNQSNFIIERKQKKVYKIELIGTFNAGVHGPSIAEQKKKYYAEIAQAKKDALSWMEDNGQDPKKVKISWDYTKY